MLRLTETQNLTYLGHSQGSTQMFTAITDEPDYWNQRINLFVSLSPAIFTDHLKTINFQLRVSCFFERQSKFFIEHLLGLKAITQDDIYPG